VSKNLLRELAFAEDADQVRKIENSIRRFVTEPRQVEAAKSKLVTFGEFSMRWATGQLHTEYPLRVKFREPVTIKNDVSRTRAVNRLIGHIPLINLTFKDAEGAINSLPETMRSKTTKRHCAQVIQTVVRYATTVEMHIPVDKYPLPIKFLPPT